MTTQQAQEEFKKWCEETNAHWHVDTDETGYGEDVYTDFSELEKYDELLEKVNSLLSQTLKDERENIINVIKKELFDTEKTLEQSAVQRDEKLVRIYKSHITAYLKIINLIKKE